MNVRLDGIRAIKSAVDRCLLNMYGDEQWIDAVKLLKNFRMKTTYSGWKQILKMVNEVRIESKEFQDPKKQTAIDMAISNINRLMKS